MPRGGRASAGALARALGKLRAPALRLVVLPFGPLLGRTSKRSASTLIAIISSAPDS